MSSALADTSIYVARASGRPLREDLIPDDLAVSAVTIGELRLGVLKAADASELDVRLHTLTSALRHEPIVIDHAVAEAWARLQALLSELGRNLAANESWIAATAMAHGLPVVTQDDDYDVDVPGLEVIRV